MGTRCFRQLACSGAPLSFFVPLPLCLRTTETKYSWRNLNVTPVNFHFVEPMLPVPLSPILSISSSPPLLLHASECALSHVLVSANSRCLLSELKFHSAVSRRGGFTSFVYASQR
jgi:hypothetical protein